MRHAMSEISRYFVLLSFIHFVNLFVVLSVKEVDRHGGNSFEFCKMLKINTVVACLDDAKSEVDQWNCYGRHIFKNKTSNYSAKNERYVEHFCGGVGWGNSIRALHNAFGLAAVLDRRLIVTYKYFDELWKPPYGLEEWDYGLSVSKYHHSSDRSNYAVWEYESFGRMDNWDKWIKSLKQDKDTYEGTRILNTGICGGDTRMVLQDDCTVHALSRYFTKCEHLDQPLVDVPFYYIVFQNPSNLLVDKLSEIRVRLNLPAQKIGYEAQPGQLGLHTPGYYILALHFRRVPLGFEPLSVSLNEEEQLKRKLEWLEGFWYNAKKIAKEAKRLASCRNETLLIYFATDDPHNLRSEAKRYLSHHGKVVFGLTLDEVGHISPQWRDQDVESIRDKANELYTQGYRSKHLSGKSKKETHISVTSDEDSELEKEKLVNHYDKSDSATQKHGIMALVEWWIIGNSNWLVSAGGTSYSDTSAGWGFSPNGKMERLDKVYGKESVSTTFRKDWSTCHDMFASDALVSKTCPNNKRLGRHGLHMGHEEL